MVDPRPELTLIVAGGIVPTNRPAAPPLHRLATAVVDVARAWGALASVLVEVIDESEEGRLRLALLDAVHDLEYAETNMAAPPASGVRPLFGGELA